MMRHVHVHVQGPVACRAMPCHVNAYRKDSEATRSDDIERIAYHRAGQSTTKEWSAVRLESSG